MNSIDRMTKDDLDAQILGWVQNPHRSLEGLNAIIVEFVANWIYHAGVIEGAEEYFPGGMQLWRTDDLRDRWRKEMVRSDPTTHDDTEPQ